MRIVAGGGSDEDFRRDAHVIDLADTPDAVAVFSKQLRHRHDVGHVAAQGAGIAQRAVGVGIESGHKRRPRRPANGVLAMHVLEAQAPLGQFVQFRCFALRMPESAQGRIEIVGHQKQNVGFLCRKDGCGKGKDSDYKTSEYWFHIIFLNERVGRVLPSSSARSVSVKEI